MKYSDWLAGWCDIEINGWFTEKAISAIAREGIDLWDIRRVNERQIKAKVWLFDEKDVAAAVKNDLSVPDETVVEIISKNGLIPSILKHKMRTGFFAGFVLFIVAAFLMLSLIWSINISGVYTIPLNELYEELENNGLFIGNLNRGHNFDEAQLALMRRFEQIAFVTINMKGSCLLVDIEESILPPDRVDAKSPQNIVAKTDGVLILCEAYEGILKVKAGESVKAGDLLISGVFPSKVIGYRLVRASGKMLAYTKKTYETFVPFEKVEQIKTGESVTKYSFSLFNINFGLPFFGSNSYEKSETITETFWLKIGKESILPISVSVSEISELSDYYQVLSEEEAKEKALSILDEEMRINLFGLEILDKEINFTVTESGVFCRINCAVIEDIAEEAAILKAENIEIE